MTDVVLFVEPVKICRCAWRTFIRESLFEAVIESGQSWYVNTYMYVFMLSGGRCDSGSI